MPQKKKEYMLVLSLYERTEGEPDWLLLNSHTEESPFKLILTTSFTNAVRVIKGYH